MAKPRKQKLKVFRTPIGFHDAFVAAPSRKAALEIWGAGTDLFQAGIAEEAKDVSTAAAKEALATPGEVVRVKRTGAVIPLERAKGALEKGKKEKAAQKPKPKPRPSRAALDKAEAALSKLEQRHAAELAEIDREEQRLANRRRALETKQRQSAERAEAKRDAADKAYRRAISDWAG